MNKILIKIKKIVLSHEIAVGVLIFFVSILFLFLLQGRNNLLASASIGITWIGVGFVFDFLYKCQTGKSLIAFYLSSKYRIIKITIASLIFSFSLDFFFHYLTRLWYYPHIPYWIYIPIGPAFYLFYSLVLFILYKNFKQILNRYVHGGRLSIINHVVYKVTMNILFVVGIIGVYLSTSFGLSNASTFNFPVYSTSEVSTQTIPIWFVLVILPSLYFIIEYACYLEKKETFVFDIIRKDFIPLIAILLANFTGIFLIEIINVPVQIWMFTNWPLSEVKFLTLPLLVWIAWPLQFLLMLSLFRFVLDKKEMDIW